MRYSDNADGDSGENDAVQVWIVPNLTLSLSLPLSLFSSPLLQNQCTKHWKIAPSSRKFSIFARF